MPTILTSNIYDGSDTSFRSYALKCAACIDYCIKATENGEKPLPLNKAPVVEPKKLYKDTIKRYEAELEEYEALKNNPERLKEAYEKAKKVREDYIIEQKELSLNRKKLKKRYEDMKYSVELWHPGKDYETLKNLMVEQLETSIEHDCSDFNPSYAELEPMDKWIDNAIECVQKSLGFYKKQYAVECDEVEKTNKYLKGLYEELDKFEPVVKTPFEEQLYHLLMVSLITNPALEPDDCRDLAAKYVEVYGSALLETAKETLDDD